jgi:hypothetical protein
MSGIPSHGQHGGDGIESGYDVGGFDDDESHQQRRRDEPAALASPEVMSVQGADRHDSRNPRATYITRLCDDVSLTLATNTLGRSDPQPQRKSQSAYTLRPG